METYLVKHKVCTSCLSIEVTDVDCVCVYENDYPIIELEFEVCSCCGKPITNHPADTEFNNKQLNI